MTTKRDYEKIYEDVVARIEGGEQVPPTELASVKVRMSSAEGELLRERGRLLASKITARRKVKADIKRLSESTDPMTAKPYADSKVKSITDGGTDQEAVDAIEASLALVQGEIDACVSHQFALSSWIEASKTEWRNS